MHDPGVVSEILIAASKRRRMTPAEFCAFVEMDLREGGGFDALAAARRYFTDPAEREEAIIAIDNSARIILDERRRVRER